MNKLPIPKASAANFNNDFDPSIIVEGLNLIIDNIEILNTRLDEIKKDNKINNDSISKSVSTNKTDILSINSNLTTINSSLKTIKNDLNSLTSRVKKLENK